MGKLSLYQIGIPAALLLGAVFIYFILTGDKRQRLEQRIARVTKRKGASIKNADALSLRKAKETGLPIIGKALQSITSMSSLRARLERAGLTIAPDLYVTACGGIMLFSALAILVLRKPPIVAAVVALALGIFLPHFVLGHMGNSRIKKFLTLFPDAIDFIVRGLRSGLPVTESMNMVGAEMPEPIGSIFSSIGESVRLGVTVEKALTDTARKLKTTEFNFFVTSIILQRETGGNLSEILNNLSDVLRKRFMMRMKIKAMASEAKASAIIVGSLPFFVITALYFVSPGYLDPLFYDIRGNKAGVGALISLGIGISIMTKMAKFEI
jgi:tight adherence protein B